MSLWALLEEAARRAPDALAVVGPAERRRSWREVRRRAARLAGALEDRGLEPGDRLAVLADNRGEILEATFAAARAGLVLVPLNTRLAPPELAAILSRAEARLVIAEEHYATRLAAGAAARLTLGPDYEAALASARERQAALRADDAPAQLYFTSGTTGRPKGVILTTRNVLTHARAAVRALDLRPSDTWGHVAPMFHLADAWATLAITAVAGRHAMLPRFDPRELVALIETERVTLTNVVPTMLQRLLALPGVEAADFASLRLCLTGGAPIAPAVVARAMRVLGCEYVQTYGLTETSPYLTLGLLPPHLRTLPQPEQLRWRAKTGRPFPAVELRVVDDAGERVPADGESVGEIQARGPTVTPGYWRDPEATAAAFADGWLRTGDLATVDAEGFLEIVDRRKDMILTGGENVYSIEVENALYEHPAVLEAAVWGVPDDEWGETVVAAVALVAGASASQTELREHCRGLLAGYKVPRRIRILPELPRTGSGKIAKQVLRARGDGPPG